MSDDSRHEQVLDHLLGLQARLRGDPPSRTSTSKAADAPSQPAPADDQTTSTLRLAPEITVRHGDVEIAPGGGSDADRLLALSERLQRVERELSSAMERLRTAEERFVGEGEEPEPPTESADLDVYRRVKQLQDLASERGTRRRR